MNKFKQNKAANFNIKLLNISIIWLNTFISRPNKPISLVKFERKLFILRQKKKKEGNIIIAV